jgi:hypothetical protein
MPPHSKKDKRDTPDRHLPSSQLVAEISQLSLIPLSRFTTGKVYIMRIHAAYK